MSTPHQVDGSLRESGDVEFDAGEAIWRAIHDPTWAPTSENLGFMARGEVTLERFGLLLARTPQEIRWSRGFEAVFRELIASPVSVDRLLSVASERELDVRYALARCGRVPADRFTPEELQDIARRFVSAGTEERGWPEGVDGWFEGFESVWTPEVWWEAVGRQVRDFRSTITRSSRIRPALNQGDDAQRAITAARLSQWDPKWALEQLEELGAAAWDPLLDLAEAIVEGRPFGGADVPRGVSVGVAAGLLKLAKSLGRGLEPRFFAALVRVAVEENADPGAVSAINDAIRALPYEHARKVLLEAPFLRWRYISAVPEASVVDWAVGEIVRLSAHSWNQQLRKFPEGEFHFGDSVSDLRRIAGHGLGEMGQFAVPFLLDGVTRASDANKSVFASALGMVGTPEAIDALIQMVATGGKGLQEAAGSALARRGDPSIDAVVARFRDADRGLRARYVHLFTSFRPSGELRAAAQDLLEMAEAPEIRGALRQIAQTPSRPEPAIKLEEALQRVPADVRAGVTRAIPARQWERYSELGAALVAIATQYAVRDLSRNNAVSDEFVKIVAKFRTDPLTPWAVSRMAEHARFSASWLSAVGPVLGPALVKPLVHALRIREGRKAPVYRAMALHLPVAAVGEFLAGVRSRDLAVARACIEGLKHAGNAGLNAVHDVVQHADPDVAVRLAPVLEGIGHPSSVPVIRAALRGNIRTQQAWAWWGALLSCAESLDAADDSALDRVLRSLGDVRLPGALEFVDLPALKYRAGGTMSKQARRWLIAEMARVGGLIDWFVPLWHSRPALVALRARLEDAPLVAFLATILDAAGDSAEGYRLSVVARALLGSDTDIANLGAHITDEDNTPHGAAPLRFHMADPRVLFLNGGAEAMRQIGELARAGGTGLVLSWSRGYLARLSRLTGMPPLGILERSYLNAKAPLSFIESLMIAQIPWQADTFQARASLWADSMEGLVLEVTRPHEIPAFYRWTGNQAWTLDGDFAELAGEVRIAHPAGMAESERVAWAVAHELPFEQLSRPVASGPYGEVGWLDQDVLAERLLVHGYAPRADEHPVGGGSRTVPEGLAEVERPIGRGWTLVLTLAREDDKPDSVRVARVRFAYQESADTPPVWVGPDAVPPVVLSESVWDLERIGRGAIPYRDDVPDEPTEAAPVVAVVEFEEDEEPSAPAAATKSADEDEKHGLFDRIFNRKKVEAAKKKAAEAAARAERRRQREALKRRRQDRANAESMRRQAAQEREARRRSDMSDRWRKVEDLISPARNARQERMAAEHAAEQARLEASLAGDSSRRAVSVRRQMVADRMSARFAFVAVGAAQEIQEGGQATEDGPSIAAVAANDWIDLDSLAGDSFYGDSSPEPIDPFENEPVEEPTEEPVAEAPAVPMPPQPDPEPDHEPEPEPEPEPEFESGLEEEPATASAEPTVEAFDPPTETEQVGDWADDDWGMGTGAETEDLGGWLDDHLDESSTPDLSDSRDAAGDEPGERQAASDAAGSEAQPSPVLTSEAGTVDHAREQEAAREEAARQAAEAARLEAERLAAEETARLEAERQAAEVARLEAERQAAEIARLEAERQAVEAARLEAERIAAEEAARVEAERQAAEAARLEAERLAAEEAARLEAERQATEAARLEADRKAAARTASEIAAATDAARREGVLLGTVDEPVSGALAQEDDFLVLEAREVSESFAAQVATAPTVLNVPLESITRAVAAERAHQEALRLEAERLAAEEAARLDAERLAAEEAARLEAERLAAEEAARLEAEHKAAILAREQELAARARDREFAAMVDGLSLFDEAVAPATAREGEHGTALGVSDALVAPVLEAEAVSAAVAKEREVTRLRHRDEAERRSGGLAVDTSFVLPPGTAESAAVLRARRAEAEFLEERRREEQARLEAERRAEEARLEAERLAAEEAARLEAERKAEEARLEAERLAAEEAARLEAERLAAEEAARLEAERKAEEARLEAERLAAEEAARIEAERKAEEARIEAERLAAEEAARLEAERLAEEARLEAERKAEEARLEAERLAAEEEARLEAERKAEEARLEAERLAAEEAARLEAERKAEEARLEAERLAAEEEARLEAERLAAEEAARLEAERLAAEEAARLEAERLAAEEAARLEAERLAAKEAARLEVERKAEEARLEAERLAAEEAARLEAERLAAEEAARLEAERLAAEEAARLEAERLAAEEAAHLEAERRAAEAARAEAERKAAEEAALLAAATEDAVVGDDEDTFIGSPEELNAMLDAPPEDVDGLPVAMAYFEDEEGAPVPFVEIEYEETDEGPVPQPQGQDDADGIVGRLGKFFRRD